MMKQSTLSNPRRLASFVILMHFYTCCSIRFYIESCFVFACDDLPHPPPSSPQAGSSQSAANVQEQERAALADGVLTWRPRPLFRVQQRADDRYHFTTRRSGRLLTFVELFISDEPHF